MQGFVELRKHPASSFALSGIPRVQRASPRSHSTRKLAVVARQVSRQVSGSAIYLKFTHNLNYHDKSIYLNLQNKSTVFHFQKSKQSTPAERTDSTGHRDFFLDTFSSYFIPF
ncbi:hypothetical protein L596_020573 [Steinernema carpocapsae]|uniref:Uncharacterized protein n=1 Tax=Steinernema carpocapsae TaxID=34508 RepID=A0A4U5MU48_STECR|nr:hypothetical protein L596_020573 [Steinernema carpocapsae]